MGNIHYRLNPFFAYALRNEWMGVGAGCWYEPTNCCIETENTIKTLTQKRTNEKLNWACLDEPCQTKSHRTVNSFELYNFICFSANASLRLSNLKVVTFYMAPMQGWRQEAGGMVDGDVSQIQHTYTVVHTTEHRQTRRKQKLLDQKWKAAQFHSIPT